VVEWQERDREIEGERERVEDADWWSSGPVVQWRTSRGAGGEESRAERQVLAG
jgi:hypothetical protein